MSIMASILADPIIIPVGSFLLATHIILFALFKYAFPPGPWKDLPSFTAHQVIAFVLMIYQTYLGFLFYRDGGMMKVNEGGVFMSQFSIAVMLLWDLPVGLVSDGLGDPVMHLHHIGAFIVAGISFGLFSNGVPIGSSYAPVFIGVIELSSIPLAIVDVFHPKQKAWHAYLATSKTLQTINEISRSLFAVLYILTRVIYFPYVVVTGVVPDSWSDAKVHPEYTTQLYSLITLSILFTVLQLYWGSLVIRQVLKVLSGGGAKDKRE